MGFNCFPSSSDNLTNLFQLLDVILYGFSAFLYQLHLNPSFPSTACPWRSDELLFSAEPAPSVLSAVALVKSRLPVVECMRFVMKKSGGGKVVAAPPQCVVCLEMLEAMDNVRELGNCRHVFHTPCIDRWIDLGQLSCPLCRAALLPAAPRGGPVSFLKAVVAGFLSRQVETQGIYTIDSVLVLSDSEIVQ